MRLVLCSSCAASDHLHARKICIVRWCCAVIREVSFLDGELSGGRIGSSVAMASKVV